MTQPEVSDTDLHRSLLGGRYNIRVRGDDTPFADLVKKEFAETPSWDGTGNIDLDIEITREPVSTEFPETVALGGGVYYCENPQALVFTTRNKGQQQFRSDDVRMVVFGDLISGSTFHLYIQPTSGSGKYLRRVLRALLKGTTNTQLDSDVSVLMSRLIEPLLYLSMPHNNGTILHAAAVERAGQGTLIFGVRDVGKTTTAMMLARSDYSLLSDDLCTLDSQGQLGAFLKPLKVEGPLLMEDPESRRNLASLPFSERFLWNVARWGKQRNPKYLFLRLLPSQLLPGISTAETASLAHVIFLENRTRRESVVSDLPRSEAVDMALAHLDIEFEALLRHQEYLHSLAMVLGVDARQVVNEHYSKIRSVIESAFSNATTKLITLSPGDGHDFAASKIREIVET